MAARLPEGKDSDPQASDEVIDGLQGTLVLGGLDPTSCFKQYLVVEVQVNVASELEFFRGLGVVEVQRGHSEGCRHVSEELLREETGELVGVRQERFVSDLLCIQSHAFRLVDRVISALFCMAIRVGNLL